MSLLPEPKPVSIPASVMETHMEAVRAYMANQTTRNTGRVKSSLEKLEGYTNPKTLSKRLCEALEVVDTVLASQPTLTPGKFGAVFDDCKPPCIVSEVLTFDPGLM